MEDEKDWDRTFLFVGYFAINVARRWKLLLYTQWFRMKSHNQRIWSPEPETVLPSVDLMILEAIKLLNL